MTSDGKQPETSQAEIEDRNALLDFASAIMADRKRSLLLLFYPHNVSIEEEQIELLHSLLTTEGFHRSAPLDSLDILIHTTGGEPTTAYRIAQVIRNFTQEAAFLVPEYAYSGGTLICMSGDEVLLGDYAVLSPIDITVRRHADNAGAEDVPRFPEEQQGDTEIELVAIDHFIKVATQARIDVEAEFRKRGWKAAESEVENAMLCEMVKELGVIEIAKLYREKNLTQEYARELLTHYMFRAPPISQRDLERILQRLIVEAPGHGFHMDYHICVDVGLKVSEMKEKLSDQSRQLVRHLTRMARREFICKIERGLRLPFFQMFRYTPSLIDTTVEDPTISVPGEVTHGDGEIQAKERDRTPRREKSA